MLRYLKGPLIAGFLLSAGLFQSGYSRTPNEFFPDGSDQRYLKFMRQGEKGSECRFNDYRIVIFPHETGKNIESVIQIFKGQKLVYLKSSHEFEICGQGHDQKYADLIGLGKDVTGQGVPDMVVWEWSGGAHCCYYLHIFELGKQFKKLDTIDMGDGENPECASLGGRPGVRFAIFDCSFHYWPYSFVESPFPKIFLAYRNGKYRLAGEFMGTPAPDMKSLKLQAGRSLGSDAWSDSKTRKAHPPLQLYGYMLDLIYGGHANLAWKYFDMAWKAGIPGKQEFLKEFEAKMVRSPYWKDIAEINKGQKLP